MITSLDKYIKLDHKISLNIFKFAEHNFLVLRFFEFYRRFYNSVAVPVFILILFKSTDKNLLPILVAWLCMAILNEFGFKRVLNRKRPKHLVTSQVHTIKKIKGFSFPSGHALNAGIVIGIALVLLNFTLTVIIVILALLVALSRVILGFHYVSDVIVGLIIGIGYGVCIAGFL